MSRRLPLALAASLVAVVVAVTVLASACGGGDDVSKTVPDVAPTVPGTAEVKANDPKLQPALTMPASRYSVSQDDLGASFLTDIPATFVLTVDNYSKTKTFKSAEEGASLLKQWGYLGGYETGYTPEGREVAVLNGAFYISVETHLFSDSAGAKKAYDFFDGVLKAAKAAQSVKAPPVGNESSGWHLVQDKVRNSNVDAAYHRILFRRGNLVVVVQTYGAEPFMKIDVARGLALIVDTKAIGQLEAIEPTPTSNFFTPSPSAASRTPTVPGR